MKTISITRLVFLAMFIVSFSSESQIITKLYSSSPPLSLTATSIQPVCYGQTGSVLLSFFGGTSPYTFDPANPPTIGLGAATYTYWISDAVGEQVSATVVINEAPPELVITDTTTQPVCFGQTGNVDLNTQGGTSPYYYNPSNPPTTGLGAGTYTYWVSDNNGCQASQTVIINEPAPAITLTGNVKYYSNSAPNLYDVTVIIIKLQPDGIEILSTTTDVNGNYSFPNVCAGIYFIVLSTTADAGGVNATDASQVNYYGVFSNWTNLLGPIEKVRLYAGDVIINQRLTSADAGRLLQYYVTSGSPNWSLRASWTFWPRNDLVSANPVAGSSGVIPYVTNISSSTTKDFWALCTGDFSRNFDPTSVKSASEKLSLHNRQNRKVNPGTDFDLPIYAETSMNVSAISIGISFPMDKLEIKDIFLNDPTAPAVEFYVMNNELKIGWYSLDPISVKAGEPLLTMRLRTYGIIDNENIHFYLLADPLNEIADADYNAIEHANINIDKLTITSSPIQAMLSDEVKLSCMPNPFSDRLILSYTLPEVGLVIVGIYNMLGEKVLNLPGQIQKAGEQSVTINTRMLLPGVYTLRLQFKTPNILSNRTLKIVRN